ncbi:hypothetical protein [Pelagicoccus enzymogenes]|uniref:hypothetical protein n=1 Tax=Pelagicoccus enzymogenes TaxID=2773457 RepID=UPI0031F2F856
MEDAEVDLHTYVSPTQDFKAADGLHFAFAIDREDPRLVNIKKREVEPDWKYADWWNQSVGDRISVSELGAMSAGTHTLKIWMVDPGVVLQRFVLDAGGLCPRAALGHRKASKRPSGSGGKRIAPRLQRMSARPRSCKISRIRRELLPSIPAARPGWCRAKRHVHRSLQR